MGFGRRFWWGKYSFFVFMGGVWRGEAGELTRSQTQSYQSAFGAGKWCGRAVGRGCCEVDGGIEFLVDRISNICPDQSNSQEIITRPFSEPKEIEENLI